MRAVITPVLAVTALVAAVLAPRVYARIGEPAPTPPAQPTPVTPAAPVASDDGVVLDVKLDRTTALAGGTLRAELTVVTPETDGFATVLPSDVVLVLDTSGSMSGAKMADAKRAAHTLLNQLGDDDRAAIVSFDGHARVDWELQAVNASAHHAVDGLGIGGSTNMSSGLSMALDTLASPAPGRARRVVLLSDGRPDSDAGLQQLASRFASAESPLTTVGIGADYDPQLLQTLADTGTGNFYWAGPHMALDQVFADEFRAARNRFASQTQLSSALGNGVMLSGVSGYGVGKGQVQLGDLFAGQRRTLFVDVTVPDDQGQIDLGHLQLAWTGVDGVRHRTAIELGQVEVTARPELVTASLDANVWEKSVIQEEFNAVRQKVSEALALGQREQAQAELESYRLRNGALNEVVGSAAVRDNLDEVQVLEQQIQRGDMDRQGMVEMSTKAYQSRRSGQAYSY